MNANSHIPATENKDWGFFGTMGRHAGDAWSLAMTAIAEATGESMQSVRIFLDSRFGRQLGDDVLNGLHAGLALQAAIGAATSRWMGWTIGRGASNEYGIPRGMAYLRGFVIHSVICEEGTA